MNDDIEITGCDLRVLIATAYALSSPQGMGYLHFTPKPLSDEEIDAILARGNECRPVGMDYVNGRSIKLRTNMRGGQLFMPCRWYDHSEGQCRELCKAIGVKFPDSLQESA